MSVADFNYSRLRGKIKEVYGTETAFAKAMGISRTTVSAKLNQSVDFTHSEMFRAAKLLGIEKENVGDYFFAT